MRELLFNAVIMLAVNTWLLSFTLSLFFNITVVANRVQSFCLLLISSMLCYKIVSRAISKLNAGRKETLLPNPLQENRAVSELKHFQALKHLQSIREAKKYVLSKQEYEIAQHLLKAELGLQRLEGKEFAENVLKNVSP